MARTCLPVVLSCGVSPLVLGWRPVGSGDFPAFVSLASTLARRPAPPCPWRPLVALRPGSGYSLCCSLTSPCRWQQRRGWLPLEPVAHRFTHKAVHRLALLHTGGDHGPHPLTKAPAPFAARPLRDVPVDHYEADGLLRQVVRRLDPRRGHKGEISRPML